MNNSHGFAHNAKAQQGLWGQNVTEEKETAIHQDSLQWGPWGYVGMNVQSMAILEHLSCADTQLLFGDRAGVVSEQE